MYYFKTEESLNDQKRMMYNIILSHIPNHITLSNYDLEFV